MTATVEARKDELSGAWKGGKWKWAKRKTLEKYDYTCQECGLREPEIMQVDHIKPKAEFPELRCDLDNLTVLCPNDHARKTAIEHKEREPWNKGAKGMQKNHNTDGLSLGRGWNKGIPVQTNTGATHFKKGHVSPNKGKKLSAEHRKKLSDSHKGQIPWNKGL